MGLHNDSANDYQLFNSGTQSGVNPGTGGTLDLRGKDRMLFTLSAGTYKLPANIPAGVTVDVLASGSVTIQNSSASTIATLTSNQKLSFCSRGSSAWIVNGPYASNLAITDTPNYSAATTVEGALSELLSYNLHAVSGAGLSTVGNGTLTAAAIVGGLVTRTGPSGAFTDTTGTGSEIETALGAGVLAPHSWYFVYKNTTSYNCTLSFGSNVSGSGQSIIPAHSTGLFRMTLVDVGASIQVNMVCVGLLPEAILENVQFNTSSTTTSVTPAAGILTGARHVFWQNTADGALSLTPRTASQLYGDIPNAYAGLTYLLTIVNRGDNTITWQAATGVTYSGEQTIATLVTRTYVVSFTSSSAVTITSASKGTIET